MLPPEDRFLQPLPQGPLNRFHVRFSLSFVRIETIADARLVQQEPRPRRVRLELVPKLCHRDHQIAERTELLPPPRALTDSL